MSRVFITGDLHGNIDIKKLNSKNFPEGNSLTKEDYVIICGDFGLVWNNSAEELYWRKWLDEKPWTTLFVDGNHENFNLLNDYPICEWKGGRIQKISSSIYHLMRGEVYEDLGGYRIFTFGGAYSHDRQYRTENKTWWRAEMPTKEEAKRADLTLAAVDNDVDIIITHDCPSHIVRSICPYDIITHQVDIEYGNDYEDINYELEYIYNKINFKEWYFGHYHINTKVKGLQCCYNKIYELPHKEN